MDFKKQLEHTRKYAAAFWEHDMIDRPMVCITAPVKDTGFRWSPAKSFQVAMSGRYEEALNSFQEMVDNTFWGGESMPHLELTLGPDQFGAFYGGKIEVSGEGFTTWIKPFVEDLEEFHAVIDKSPDGYFQRLKNFFDYAAPKAKDHFMLHMLDLHSNLDAISAVRGAMDLCYDVIDSPETVKRVLDEVNASYNEIYDMAYKAGNMADVGTLSWLPVYCQGKSAILQCDFSCMLSPEQGREFVFPAIEYEASQLDHNIYHLDGVVALQHLDTILSMDKIDCIQWVPGAGQPPTMEWMDLLKTIQAAGKAVWIGDWSPEVIKQLHKELKPNLVVYDVWAKSQDEAEDLLEFLSRNS